MIFWLTLCILRLSPPVFDHEISPCLYCFDDDLVSLKTKDPAGILDQKRVYLLTFWSKTFTRTCEFAHLLRFLPNTQFALYMNPFGPKFASNYAQYFQFDFDTIKASYQYSECLE